MLSDSATRRFAWIVGVHALLLVATSVAALPANGAVPFTGGGNSAATKLAINFAWYAVVFAQVGLLKLYAAFGAAFLTTRLVVLMTGLAYSLGIGLWWTWMVYLSMPGTFSTTSDFDQMAWQFVPRELIAYGLPSLALLCLRSRIGVIRRASPLPRHTGKRLSVLNLLVVTTAVAAVTGGFRLLADQGGDEFAVAAFILHLLVQVAKIAGLAIVAFSARRRWAGGLIWIVAVAVRATVMAFQARTSPQILLQQGAIELLTLTVVLATLWPLRRAGYRLTKP